MSHERRGKSDEWYTPKYVFDALGVVFDLDVAHPRDHTHTPQYQPYNSFMKHRWKRNGQA